MGKINIKRKVSKEKLQEASKAYYNSSEPIISDEEYDAARETLDLDDELLAEVGASEEGLEKIEHEIPMGSLNKTPIEELTKWANDVNDGLYHVSWKIDGLSMSLKYKDGKLVDAITRGNGKVGGRAMFSIKHIPDIQVLNQSYTGYIRGEVYISKTSFEAINLILNNNSKKEFANPRNAAAGIVRNEGAEFAGYLSFCAFDMNNTKADTMKEMFLELYNLGFSTPELCTCNVNELKLLYDKCASSRNNIKYEVDGLVVSCSTRAKHEKLGVKDNRPKWSVALKFPAPKAITKLIDVEFTMGHTGAIVPTAVLESIQIAGTTVQHALLCNQDEITRLDLRIGDMVVVSKRGDIIPKIEGRAASYERLGNEVEIKFPTTCNHCGGAITRNGANMYCLNEQCPERLIRKMISFVSGDKMNMMHIGEKAIRKMHETKIAVNVKELLNLTSSTLVEVFGVNGSKMYDSIQEVINKQPHEFIGSLGIEGCGKRRTKEVITSLGITSSVEFVNITKRDLIGLDGFQDTLAEKVADGIASNRDLILAMPNKIKFNYAVSTTVDTKGSICFTGAVQVCDASGERLTRKKLQALAQDAGFEVQDSVIQNLTYLVQADPSSESSKTKKALKYGTKIISDVEFLKMVGA